MSDSRNKKPGKSDRPTVTPNFTLKEDFEPFSEWDSIFGRVKWDKDMKTYKIFMYDKVPQILDEKQIGYTQISIFGRVKWDKDMKTYKIFMYDKVPQILDEKQIGYTQIDHALAIASWTTHDYFRLAFSWEKLGNPNNMMPGIQAEKYKIDDENIERITKTVKAVAKSFGASMVGIAPYNPDWVYTEDRAETPIDMPEGMTRYDCSYCYRNDYGFRYN